MNSPLVLVTGATGAVGPRVVQALHEAGHPMRTLSYDAPSAGMLPLETMSLLGDVTDLATVQSAMQGVEIVIHMAAKLHIVQPPPELREKYERVNVGGTQNVVRAAMEAEVKRVVLLSTIAVYGPAEGQLLTETSPTRPDGFYAETKLAAERIVLNAKRTDGQPLGLVLRLGAVYGSRMKGNYQRLLQALARGRFVPVGHGRNRRTLVYDRDVARAAVLAAIHPDAAGKVYNVTDGMVHSLNDIIAAMCEALGRRPPRLAMPFGPARAAVGMLEDMARWLGHPSPIGRATLDKYVEDVAVDGQCMQTELGYAPQYDLRTGWRETIEDMRRSGQL